MALKGTEGGGLLTLPQSARCVSRARERTRWAEVSGWMKAAEMHADQRFEQVHGYGLYRSSLRLTSSVNRVHWFQKFKYSTRWPIRSLHICSNAIQIHAASVIRRFVPGGHRLLTYDDRVQIRSNLAALLFHLNPISQTQPTFSTAIASPSPPPTAPRG